MSAARSPVYYLLVDDLEENLLALQALLKREGLTLLTARSGPEALELLLKYDVALALIDVQMPIMDGLELAELMRGTERTRRVPIIFLTAGSADVQRLFRGYEAGAVDLLYKPIDSQILRSKADVFFELYLQRQEVAMQRDELKLATEENSRLLQESRQYAAALQEADRRKDEFMAMLAHELRNPLAPIWNAVEILRMAELPNEEDVQAREIIARQVSHMSRLIDDLLDVARVARGKVELRMQDCDLTQIVRQTTEDYASTLSAAGLDMRLILPAQPITVRGDRTRLAQVIGNLLHNASKFTPTGGHVIVEAKIDTRANVAVLSVSDNGAGLEANVLAMIFEPFSQVNQSLDRKKGGLGLGLALTKGLMELHGGSVSAQSGGPGLGATFTLRLPLAATVVEKPKTAPLPQTAVEDSLKVLLIEDNLDAARSLERLLSLLGHDVKVAFDGPTGLTLAREFQPQVILSDLGLPGDVDGYEFARRIRADEVFSDAHLIALSGYGNDEDRKRTKAAGFHRHLVKPIDLVVIKSILAEIAKSE